MKISSIPCYGPIEYSGRTDGTKLSCDRPQTRITKFGPEVLNNLVKITIISGEQTLDCFTVPIISQSQPSGHILIEAAEVKFSV